MRVTADRDFLKLWSALSVSLMGSEITELALPLLAALTLRASALEMGVLAAAGQIPFLLFSSLPAGVWGRSPPSPAHPDRDRCGFLSHAPFRAVGGSLRGSR
jgi:hypothetical protein